MKAKSIGLVGSDFVNLRNWEAWAFGIYELSTFFFDKYL